MAQIKEVLDVRKEIITTKIRRQSLLNKHIVLMTGVDALNMQFTALHLPWKKLLSRNATLSFHSVLLLLLLSTHYGLFILKLAKPKSVHGVYASQALSGPSVIYRFGKWKNLFTFSPFSISQEEKRLLFA